MASFNKVILIGNIATDLELKQTPNGVSVTSFKIAVGRKFQKGNEQQADFINVVAWRNTAEFICKYFSKGKPILVVGSIQTRSWAEQNGNKRFTTEVVAEEAQFVEKKNEGAPNQTPSENGNASNTPYSDDATGFEEVTDDELPF